MATATIEVPEVYSSLLRILGTLSVAKNGTLPSNMGGKPYLTAVDVARETKALFVEEHLILIPNESIHTHELVTHKDRINVAISITGEYTIISTKDGSSVTISGTGDGLAGGTAVASNIASTNALKNALLRTFLITEQSVEDAGKSGPSETATDTKAARQLDQARSTPTAPAKTAPSSGGNELDTLKAQVRAYIGSDDAKRDAVNAALVEFKSQGLSGVELNRALVAKFVG